MEIRSAPGRGTEVKVRLPIRRLPAATKVLALERKTAGA
jgi:hypothetical protein